MPSRWRAAFVWGLVGVVASVGSWFFLRWYFPGSRPFTRECTLDDLRGVGVWKPMGYLAACRIEHLGAGVDDLRKELDERGLATFWSDEEHWHGPHGEGRWSGGPGGAIFACDRAMLGKLLDENRPVLERAHWPTEPEAFMRRVTTEQVMERDDRNLYRLIGLAFADPRFS